MFRHIFAFELRYQLQSPVFLIGFVLFFLFAFGATTSDNVQIGASANVYVNSPYAILQTLATMSVIAIFLATALVAGAVIRDDETGFAPLLRATRIAKPAYVLGRFGGASCAAFVALCSVPLGMLIGSWMPWLDPETLGPFVAWHYVYALLVIGLPTMLLVSAALFALATATRSLMWTYVGAVLALVLLLVSRSYLRDQALDTLSGLSDPFGLSALSQTTRYWTVSERNTLLPAIEGMLLWNRLLWGGVSALLLALAYAVFRMDGGETRKRDRGSMTVSPADIPPVKRARQGVAEPVSRTAGWMQLLAIARFDAATVFRSPAFLVLLAIGVLNSFGGMRHASEYYGIGIYPVTRAMISALEDSFLIIPLIIAIYYAGELVWRDRQHGLHEIVDATSAPDWAHLLPKIVAIAGVLLATILVGVITAVGYQLVNGYTRLEPGAYLVWLVLPQAISALQLAVLAILVQVLVPHKMIGHAVMMVYVVATISLVGLGFEHNLYNYGGAPPVPLSDMNGQGHFWTGRAWFQAYWSAFAVLLAVLATQLRGRGAGQRLLPRLARLPGRLRGTAGRVAALAGLCWLVLGCWIFYNTNVLNEYVTKDQRERRLAEYEKALLGYESVAQPRVVDMDLDVQVYPRRLEVLSKGTYILENRTQDPLAEVHVSWPAQTMQLDSLSISGATLRREYPEFGYRIYALEPAMAPGEQRSLEFSGTVRERGFRNDAGPQRVVENGTFLNSSEFAPGIGVQRGALLNDRAVRRKYGLPPELRMAKLEDESARQFHYVSRESDWVTARMRLGTDADQVPLAPGDVVSDTVEAGRRTLVTRADQPILGGFSVQSARYEIARREHDGIALSVYYQPGHAYNVERMLDAMGASLDLFQREFSPYQFRYARILEFPAYATFAQAFAGTVPYSEAIGFIMNPDLDTEIDMVSYVTAHEMAHQWWAHQLIGADMQGATFLSETLAQYSALLVMEKLRGVEHIQRFLKYELDRYLRARGEEVIEELPLARVENQPYIHYRKGALAMYWLKEVVGEASVNRALRRLLEEFAFRAAPYPSTRDFLRVLREEAGAEHEALIHDLFERIVLLDARAVSATASPRKDGRWDLRLEVDARKLVADGRGVEQEEPLDEVAEIGVFSERPGAGAFGADSVLLRERPVLRSGRQVFERVVDSKPLYAGVDPYNMRIDRNAEDNLVKVQIVAATGQP